MSRNSVALSQARCGRSVLGVEQLEDRCVPACTVTPTGVAPNVVLTILGDNANNSIQISDDGNGNITVTCDGVASLPVAGVRDIVVNGRKGRDSVFYTLTADLAAAQTRNVTVDLGEGNDLFLAQAINNADIMGTAALSFNIKGNLGNDHIRFSFTDDFDVNAAGILGILVNGNEGNDRIALVQLGAIDGNFNLALNGNAGRDRVGASLNLDSSSAGVVNAVVRGQADNDLLTLLLTTGEGVTATLTGKVSGGGGINTAVATDGVTVQGVPADNLLRFPA
jgi:hypothetical protein